MTKTKSQRLHDAVRQAVDYPTSSLDTFLADMLKKRKGYNESVFVVEKATLAMVASTHKEPLLIGHTYFYAGRAQRCTAYKDPKESHLAYKPVCAASVCLRNCAARTRSTARRRVLVQLPSAPR